MSDIQIGDRVLVPAKVLDVYRGRASLYVQFSDGIVAVVQDLGVVPNPKDGYQDPVLQPGDVVRPVDRTDGSRWGYDGNGFIRLAVKDGSAPVAPPSVEARDALPRKIRTVGGAND